MSNSQLDALFVTGFVAHLAVLALAVFWPRVRRWVIGVNALDAAGALVWLAIHPRWFLPPPDWQILGWAGFELTALAVSAVALGGKRAWVVAAWVAFSGHALASGLAALFALTFRITRLF